jgi:predicted esterase YcpF (UPF0227 family)
MPTTHLLYLHGFRSSPQSAKALRMAEAVAAGAPRVVWWCPQLPPSPREAMARVAEGIRDWPADGMAVVGSSLGGYYASWVQARRSGPAGCPKAVLLNPAVDPARDLARYIGQPQTQWHRPEESFFFDPAFIDELRALRVPPRDDPARQLAVIAEGDEVLDAREMRARYAGARQRLVPAGAPGSDHALSAFDTDHLAAVLDFLDLAD